MPRVIPGALSALLLCLGCGRATLDSDSLVNGDQPSPHKPLNDAGSDGGAQRDSNTEQRDATPSDYTALGDSSAHEDTTAVSGAPVELDAGTRGMTPVAPDLDAGASDAGRGSAAPVEGCGSDARCDAAPAEHACAHGYAGETCDECDVGGGYVQWPPEPTTCVPDPCIAVTCAGLGPCHLDGKGFARCDCDNGMSGPKCNETWAHFTPPPSITDVRFDALGNGWFYTTRGLVYWDLNGTPNDTSDDAWQLLDQDHSLFKSVATDSQGRLWTASGSTIRLLDDGGTPLDPSDDEWQTYTFDTYWRSQNYLARFRLDARDRAWLIQHSTGGVKMLPELDLFERAEIPWITLFSGLSLNDVAGEGDGVWLAAATGSFYVDLGSDLSDEADDRWIDFSAVPLLADKHVVTILIDSLGGKWFNTDKGMVHLDDGGDPFDQSKHEWTLWSPPSGSDSSGDGPIMAFGPDGSPWLGLPAGSVLRIDGTAPAPQTEYDLAATSLFRSFTEDQRVGAISFDPEERIWLTVGGELYRFDHGHTPTDPSDDVWIRMGRPQFNANVVEVHADPNGEGVWVLLGVPQISVPDDNAIYYVHLGEPENAFDDVWIRYYDELELGFSWNLYGFDSKGILWSRNDNLFDPDPARHILMNGGGTPLDASDDTLAIYAARGAAAPWPNVVGFDPSGVWFEDGYLDYGQSMTDTDDDLWVALDSFKPNTMAVDATGNRWFGYRGDAARNVGIGGALRSFDDGGTLTKTDDDTWVDFSLADGLPFYEPDYRFFNISDVQIDAHGLIWIADGSDRSETTSPRLCNLDDNGTAQDKSDDTWTAYLPAEGIDDRRIEHMTIDGNSDLWLATSGGLRYLHVER